MTLSWKRIFTLLLSAALLLTGCSAPQETLESTIATGEVAVQLADPEQTSVPTEATESPEPKVQLIDLDGMLYAEELGAPVLGLEKVRELYQENNLDAAAEAITNIGDALFYLRESGEFAYSWDACDMFYALLAGDYETVQTLKINFTDHSYDLMYILQDGVYHIFDPYNLEATWIYDSYNDCVGHSDFNLLCDKLVAAFPYENTAMVTLETPGDLTRFFSGYPAALVEPILGQEKVESLYKARNEAAAAEAITAVGDALYYIIAADMHSTTPGKQPRDAVNMMRKLLAGDYEAVDCLGSNFNDNGGMDLLLVQHDGVYYAFDVFNPYGDWTFRASSNFNDQDLVRLIERLIAVQPYEGTILQHVFVIGDVAQRDYGMPNDKEPCFTVLDAETLQKANEHRADLLANGTRVDILRKFEVYDDTLVTPVLGREKVTELYKTADLDVAAEAITNITDAFYYLEEASYDTAVDFSNPLEACKLVAHLIGSDYDSVGYIDFNYIDSFYRLIYIEDSGVYSAFDPFRATTSWILRSESENASGTNLDNLSKKLLSTFPFKGTEFLSIQIVRNALTPLGAEEYSYLGTTLPVALGQPQLSDKEIDALIADGDYEKIAQTVNTLPDAVNYITRAGITYSDEPINQIIGRMNYCYSACQLIKNSYSPWSLTKNGDGQCTMFSNLIHYLLEDDYDEVGYVSIRSPGDGHIMVYIYQDGLYYLIDPSQYGTLIPSDWLESFPAVLGCSDDFQDIADSIIAQWILPIDKKHVNQVHLVKSPGDFVDGESGRCHPIGTEVVPYYGIKDIVYIEAEYEWDTQTRIDY